MKKYSKRILAGIMSFVMLLTMVFPVQVQAGTPEEIEGEKDINTYSSGDTGGDSKAIENGKYAIIHENTNKAVSNTNIGWQNKIKLEAPYFTGSGQVGDSAAQFTITSIENGIQEPAGTLVNIELETNGKTLALVNEKTGVANRHAFISTDMDSSEKYNDNCKFIIKETDESGKFIIYSVSSETYATVDDNDGSLVFYDGNDEKKAEKFLFIKDPDVLETSFSIEHKATGKYIKTYEQADTALTVDGKAGDEDTKFSKTIFGKTGNYVAVSLVSKSYGKGINSGKGDKVVVEGQILGNGWESIRVIPNGDGTISFKDSLNGYYITVKEEDNKPVLVRDESVKTPADNEKFIIHTQISPEPATNLAVDNSNNRVDSSINLKWENPECLFTGIKIYQKEDGGDFEEIANLTDVESYKIENLDKAKEYTFKTRVVIGSGESALYADSNEITGTPIENNNIISFSRNSLYGIISGDKAINVKGLNYMNHIKVNASYKGNNSIEGENVEFRITPQDDYSGLATDELKVMIECLAEEEGEKGYYPLRTESGNDYSFADNENSTPRYDGTNEMYIIKKTGDNQGTIKAVSNSRYAVIDNGELRFADGTSETSAVKFTFIENPVVTAPGTSEPPETVEPPETAEPPESSGGEDSIVPGGNYAIISKTTGFALNTKIANWVEDSLMADALYDAKSGKIGSANAKFTIEKTGNYGDAVKIVCNFNGEKYPIRVEDGNEYGFADPSKRDTEDEYFIIESTGNSTFKIKTNKGRYAIIEPSSGKLLFKAATTKDQAEEFIFIKDPALFDTSIYIQHKASGKYIKTYEAGGVALTVNGNKGDKGTVFSNLVFGTNKSTASGEEYTTASFISKDYGNGMKSVVYDAGAGNADGAKAAQVVTYKGRDDEYGTGWESVRVVPNGDGTISFKDSYFDQYITVQGISMACRKIAEGTTRDQLTDKEKFIVCTDSIPEAVTSFEVNQRTRTKTTLDLTWNNPLCLYTSAVIEQKKASGNDSEYKIIATLGDEKSYTVTGLEKGTDYKFRIHLEFYNGTDTYSSKYAEISGSTIETDRPAAPSDVHVKESTDGVLELSWDKVAGASGYNVYEARSKYDKDGYKKLGYFTEEKVAIPVGPELNDGGGRDKYSYYFYVQAVAGSGNNSIDSEESGIVSLETEMFGEHTIFFAETDDEKKIDKVLADIFKDANDIDKDAQFNGQQWQIYFKPGDYTKAGCMYLGFYTSFNGLGKTPYDVKLNNIAIPAYLPAGELSDTAFNATCNFWRSAENLSVIFTGNEQGRAKEKEKGKEGNDCYRPESFNWAVAQAAPLRRVYSERPVAYDWNFGWASGGYVADCYFVGADEDGNSAGTASGQQFFTRNTKVEGNTYGTTLNNFYLGVEAENNLTAENGTALKNNNGFTNWGIQGNKDENGKTPQQVVTEITETPKISEKPFLYLDNGEYRVFIPAVQENRRGISWGEGKENGGMGKGTSLPLSDFYIAKPSDTAANINQHIKAGNNIYFTPGIYHAEEPIIVDRENAILLGSGMTSIIPYNEEMAMKVYDLDGIRIEGLIFDAGLSSKYLLQVGEEKTDKSHSGNPIVLQDLFFRVGGTTDVLTKADDALEINCNDVICDHFWIWRADHGAGVEWYGNESKHGLIVNGDNVNCYALFNEHFQEYHTLWNGENGATYFYQNETCYDPISQEAWMSHGGTVKGYSSYKVSNDVKKHYAIGLGVYNVFIYTGPLYDAKGVGIQLDNAIEVPNSEDVLVENACIQTFANDDGALARINHIINGVGGSASSGYNNETGERGESWSRKFLLYYNNGMAEYGKETDPSTFNFVNGADPKDQRNQFIGTEKRTAENPVEEPEDEKIFLDRIEQLVKELSVAVEADYTKNSWKNAELEKALAKAREMIEVGKQVLSGTYNDASGLRRAANYSQYFISKIQSEINKACTTLEAAGEKLVYIGNAAKLQGVCEETINEADYVKNDKWYAYKNALAEVERILKESENADISTKKKVYELQLEIDAAYEALRLARLNLTGEDDALNITGLREAYDKYAAYKQSDYKAEGWAEFAKALADAKAELDKGTKAVQEDIDKALAALNTAAGKLVKVTSGSSTNISKLKEAYNKYAAYKQSDYRIEGWAEFAKALADAKVQLDKGDSATESDVLSALAALNTAAGKLVKNSSSGNSGNSSGGGSSLDSWLEGMLSNALATNNNSNVDTSKLLDAITGLTDAKTDLDETQGKADALFEIINSLIGNTSGSAVKVTGISLNKSSLSLDKGKKAVLKATITPSDATNKDIIWNSDNVKVASVDKKGNVKAVNKGTASITATTADGLKTAVCKVTVKIPAAKVTINTKKLYIVKGNSIKLKTVMTPSGTTDKIKWSTSDSSVVSVKNGKIKAKKTGTSVITAKASSGKKATCKVYVVKNAKKAISVKLNKNKVSMKKGSFMLLSAILKPLGSTDTVKWKSSNQQIASVDVYGFVKAKKKGKATITVTIGNGKKVTCKITVK